MTVNNQDIQPAIDKFKTDQTKEGLRDFIASIQHLSKPEQKRILDNVQRNTHEAREQQRIESAKANQQFTLARMYENNLKKWITKGRPLQYG